MVVLRSYSAAFNSMVLICSLIKGHQLEEKASLHHSEEQPELPVDRGCDKTFIVVWLKTGLSCLHLLDYVKAFIHVPSKKTLWLSRMPKEHQSISQWSVRAYLRIADLGTITCGSRYWHKISFQALNTCNLLLLLQCVFFRVSIKLAVVCSNYS